MGGMHGLGPIAPEPAEPVFHAEWERRVHALVIASPTRGNIDAGRHQRELIPGPEYLRGDLLPSTLVCGDHSALLLQDGFYRCRRAYESGRGRSASPTATPRLVGADAVAPALSRPRSYRREAQAPPAFKPGDQVRARNLHPSGHTRLPRYVRGRIGVIERFHGAHVYPDSHADGRGEDARPLYTVCFAARELWGPDAAPRDSVSLDLWEPYLERA